MRILTILKSLFTCTFFFLIVYIVSVYLYCLNNRAYREDQLTKTHPVAGVVTDTDAAVANFDGLTYGASPIHYLLLLYIILYIGSWY